MSEIHPHLVSETRPHDVLEYWIGRSRNDPAIAKEHHKLWFNKSEQTDREIDERFRTTLLELAEGPMADDWSSLGPHGRLAAIIVLDQFSRNIFRDTPQAFAQDEQALVLCKRGILGGDDEGLSEVERVFFYLPLEHSESAGEQEESIRQFTKLYKQARPEFKDFCENTLEYAYAHKEVIDRFGRYPHRNHILGRESTPDEIVYLDKPGSGF